MTNTILVTPEQAARLLQIGRSTIYELMREDHLQSVKIGRSRRIAIEEIQRFISNLVQSHSLLSTNSTLEDLTLSGISAQLVDNSNEQSHQHGMQNTSADQRH